MGGGALLRCGTHDYLWEQNGAGTGGIRVLAASTIHAHVQNCCGNCFTGFLLRQIVRAKAVGCVSAASLLGVSVLDIDQYPFAHLFLTDIVFMTGAMYQCFLTYIQVCGKVNTRGGHDISAGKGKAEAETCLKQGEGAQTGERATMV